MIHLVQAVFCSYLRGETLAVTPFAGIVAESLTCRSGSETSARRSRMLVEEDKRKNAEELDFSQDAARDAAAD